MVYCPLWDRRIRVQASQQCMMGKDPTAAASSFPAGRFSADGRARVQLTSSQQVFRQCDVQQPSSSPPQPRGPVCGPRGGGRTGDDCNPFRFYTHIRRSCTVCAGEGGRVWEEEEEKRQVNKKEGEGGGKELKLQRWRKKEGGGRRKKYLSC